MAKTKTKAPEKETLPQEKIEKVEVKKLLKDERTHKIAGSICLLLSILLFIAFTSYLFTWDEDQDKVFKDGYKLLLGTDTKVANLMGNREALTGQAVALINDDYFDAVLSEENA